MPAWVPWPGSGSGFTSPGASLMVFLSPGDASPEHPPERVTEIEIDLGELGGFLLQLLYGPEPLFGDLIDDREGLEEEHLAAHHKEHPAVNGTRLGRQVGDER